MKEGIDALIKQDEEKNKKLMLAMWSILIVSFLFIATHIYTNHYLKCLKCCERS